MSKPGNHRKSWEPHEWDRLRNLLEQDVSIEYMARKLGRTPGATAVAIHRLRHGKQAPTTAPQMGAKFTSYTRAQVEAMNKLDRLTHKETKRVKRRARVLFNVVLFGLRFTITKKRREHGRQ